MQDKTIIATFKKLENHMNQYIQANQQNMQQAFNAITGLTITLDAFIGALVERGIITGDEMRSAIQREQQKRQAQMQAQAQQQKKIEQPVIDTEANAAPTVEAEMEMEDSAGSPGVSG